MGLFGSILGGGLGWVVAGPIGGIIGAVIGGSLSADASQSSFAGTAGSRRTRPGDFTVSLLVLTAAVLKADGKVLKSEINFVRGFLKQQIKNPDLVQEYMTLLRDILKQDINTKEVASQIRHHLPRPDRLELLRYLFAISQSDGHVDKEEVRVIEYIAMNMGITSTEFESIKAMFYKDAGAAYKILEIDSSATDQEVKKAYRKMAVKYHPDKLSQLGEDYQKSGKEKFQKVQEAYETIKKERGMN